MAVPAAYSDSQLKKVMKETVLSFSWRNSSTKAWLIRVGMKGGVTGAKRAPVLNGEVVAAISGAIETDQLTIVECREAKEKEKDGDAAEKPIAPTRDSPATTTALIISKTPTKALDKLAQICMAGKESASSKK